MFFQLTPLADMVVPADDFEFITRLWQDWSPGYDCAEDVARFVACMDGAGRVEAALGYYRQTLQPELQDPALEAAQNGAYSPAARNRCSTCTARTTAACASRSPRPSGDVLTVPGSRAVMVDGAGHFLQLERPDVVNAEILSFLSELTRAAPGVAQRGSAEPAVGAALDQPVERPVRRPATHLRSSPSSRPFQPTRSRTSSLADGTRSPSLAITRPRACRAEPSKRAWRPRHRRRPRRRIGVGVSGEMPGAPWRHRALSAAGCPRAAQSCTHVQQTLVPRPPLARSAATHRPAAVRPGARQRRSVAAGEDAPDVGVDHRDVALEREGQHRSSGVRTDAGQRQQCVEVVGEPAAVRLLDLLRCGVQRARTSRVAEALPLDEHVAQRRGGTCCGRRPPFEERLPPRHDPVDLGLLEHHL